MPVSAPRDSTIAIVGDGFGSLIVFATAVYLGFRPSDITVYGPSDNPVGTYQQFAYNLGQTVLRSESESHFLPADWPTFAQLDAWSRRSAKPLVRSIRRKYNPGVPDVLAEAGVVQRSLGWEGSRVPARVGWLQREEGPAHFVLYDEQASLLGRAKHVMLALGHGPLAYPPVLARAKADDPEIDARIVQAYGPKQYHAEGRYIVIGAGIAGLLPGRARRGRKRSLHAARPGRRSRAPDGAPRIEMTALSPSAQVIRRCRRARRRRRLLPCRWAGNRPIPGDDRACRGCARPSARPAPPRRGAGRRGPRAARRGRRCR